MGYTHNYGYCLGKENADFGMNIADFEKLRLQANKFANKIATAPVASVKHILDALDSYNGIENLKALSENFRDSFEQVVVFGTGGSTLGGKTIYSACKHLNIDKNFNKPNKPTIIFFENIDPYSFEGLFQRFDPKKTGLIFCSKSGETPETIAHLLLSIEEFKRVKNGIDIGKHFITVTQPGKNSIRTISMDNEIVTIDSPSKLGGRFSAFSVNSLLPAMIAGLDVIKFREGGKSVVDQIRQTKLDGIIEPASGAALAVGLSSTKGKCMSVIMTYVDRLEDLGKWYRQLWAESLGKDGKGSTPINALGTIDQHSQLQLYLDGPKDKWFSVISINTENTGPQFPDILIDTDDLDYLKGKKLGDLMAAEQKATIETLYKNLCPVRTFNLSKLDEFSLGSLMMHFILETLISAELMNINPFDQPAVESGKVLTRNIMSGLEK